MIATIFIVPLVAIGLFAVLGNGRHRQMFYALPFASVAVIWLIGGGNAVISGFLLALPFFAVREIRDKINASKSVRRLIFWLTITVIISLFAVLKDYFGIGQWYFDLFSQEQGDLGRFKGILATLGLSFLVFRVYEYQAVSTVQIKDKEGALIPQTVFRRLMIYFNFCFAFPAFSSGPILRWREYSKDLALNKELFSDHDDMLRTFQRLSNGLLKLAVFSQPLLIVILASVDQISLYSEIEKFDLWQMAFVSALAVFYLHFLFLNFSAFSDTMIASARFVNLRLPENFDRPFTTYGFLDFFNHWHLSVSQWFRDMVFTPVSRWAIMQGIKSNTLCSVLAFLLTFGLLGLWHGRTWPFLICGLMLGLGAVINQTYRDIFRKKVEDWLVKGSGKYHVTRQLLRGLTYFYIAVAIMGLWLPAGSLAVFWKSAASFDFLLISIVLIAGYALVLTMSDRVFDLLKIWISKIHYPAMSKSILVIIIKLSLAIIIWQLFNLDSKQSFIYEGF